MKKLAILLILSISFLFASCGSDSKDDSNDPKDKYELTVENVADTCNVEIACGIFDNPDTVSDCVMYTLDLLSIDKDSTFGKQYYDYVLKIEGYIECVYNSSDCDAYAACIDVVITEETCDSNYVASCSGDIKSSCNQYGRVIKEDCTFGDQTCISENGDTYCDDKVSTECEDDTYVSTCNSGEITFCQSGKIFTVHCDSITGDNSVCTTDDSGAFCQGTNDTVCDYYEYTESCSGDYKVICGDDDTVTEIDCKKLWGADYTCTMMDSEYGKYATCMYKNVLGTCSELPSCNGNVLNYCVDGENKTFDCLEFGYSSCSEGTTDIPASCVL